MDDLDRLAFRVARTVRTTYPHLLERGFTLSDLEERLAPFTETRREMAEGGPDGYEQTVLRLLAGERGYLSAEPALQEACRRALQMASPAVSLVRTWAGSTLTLRGTALTLGGERMAPVSVVSDRHSGAFQSSTTAHMDHPATQPYLASVKAMPGVDVSATKAGTGCACHFCGGALPTGRNLTYCPHCGLNLTVRQCPACSTELERNWRFCVSCGRQAEDVVENAQHNAQHSAHGAPHNSHAAEPNALVTETAHDSAAAHGSGLTSLPDAYLPRA